MCESFHVSYYNYLQGLLANCANNCPGVDPNSIIGGGVASVLVLGPALGLGALGVAGAGGAAAAMGMFSQCPRSRPCRVRGIYRVTALYLIRHIYRDWVGASLGGSSGGGGDVQTNHSYERNALSKVKVVIFCD